MPDQPSITAPNRKYVSPSFTSLADPFYSTIQAAINSITDASLTNAYTIFIYPGTYNEAVTLKSYVSIVGAGVDDVIIKGTGSTPAVTGPAADSGSGQCYISNLTIDGVGQNALLLPDSNNSKTLFVFNVQIISSVPTTYLTPAIVVNNAQSFDCFHLHCIDTGNPNYSLYQEGILVNGTGNLRMWQSDVTITPPDGDFDHGFCIHHLSSAYSEAYNSFLSSKRSSIQAENGFLNLYNCQTVGGVRAKGYANLKHVNSFHDGRFITWDHASMWVTGMKWGEESGIDVFFELYNSSRIIVANSKAGVTNGVPNVVYLDSNTVIFKAFNSEFNNLGGGSSIVGPSTNYYVYLYYCVLRGALSNISASGDSNYKVSSSSE